MILRINELKDINFAGNYINILEIENKKLFSNIILALNNLSHDEEADEQIVLLEDDQLLDLSKETFVLFDIFNIDYQDKKISTALNKNIVTSFNNEYEEKIKLESLLKEVTSIVRQFVYDFDFELDMNENLTLDSLLKVLSIKVDTMCLNTLELKLKTFIDLFTYLKLYKLLILVNVKSYFSDEELVSIYKHIKYRNLNVLFIEPSKVADILEYEYKIIIDSDFCDYTKAYDKN